MSNKTTTQKYLITLTVMLVAIIEVLDMTIVNVSLPAMMGSLGANSEEITWVLTSYIVSAAILMPLTGVLIERMGQRRLLIYNIIGFLIASMLCGIAQSLSEIVFFRIAQGVFGASLVPLSQVILRNTFSKEEQGQAMALWGVGIMVAPVLGPTVGGYITEHLNWRWVFYLNLPVCILAFFLALRYIEETPIVKKSIDWVGVALMSIGIGALQIFLDQGNSKDWFQSDLIVAMAAITVVMLAVFVIRGLRVENNIINLRLFKDRNFCLSTIIITLFISALLGVISIQPMMLESLLHYPTETTGMLMAPRGIASAICMGIVAQLINRYSARKLIAFGLIFSLIGTVLMTQFKLNTPMFTIVWVGIIQGMGMGFFFVPLSTIAFTTLKQKDVGEAAGLFSFGRSLGSSIGISVMSTLISRETQINWSEMSGHLSIYNHQLMQFLQAHHLDPHAPKTAMLLAQQLGLHANFNAYIDSYLLAAMSFVVLLPFLYFLKEPEKNEQSSELTAH